MFTEFGANSYYGASFDVNARIMGMTASSSVTPYGGVTVFGKLELGNMLYGELLLEGSMCDMRFPSTTELAFSKFPLDVK